MNLITIENWALITYGVCIFVCILIQASNLALTAGIDYAYSNRANTPKNKSDFGYRVDHTLRNNIEGLCIFLPFAVVAGIHDISNTWTQYAAIAIIISRILYMPIYFSGLTYPRTIVWLLSYMAIPFFGSKSNLCKIGN